MDEFIRNDREFPLQDASVNVQRQALFWGAFNSTTKTYVKKLKLLAFYWPLKAFPIDAPVLGQLKVFGCKTLMLHVADTDDWYTITMEEFLQHAQAIDWRSKDRRFPMRWYCPLDFWQKVGEEAA